jgi:glycosyltransferase involved in cell wall biosynthesis
VRVLFLAHAYPRFETDPVGSFVGNLAVALRAHDIEVTVSAPSAAGLAPQEMINGISVNRFRYAPEASETLAYTGTMGSQVRDTLGGKLAMASYLVAAYHAASALDRAEPYDLVHAHWWFPAGLVATGLRRMRRVPFVTTMHGSDLRLASTFPMGERLFRHVAARAASMTAVSSWLARGAERLSPATSVVVAPMPVVSELFAPGSAQEREPHRLLFVGKLTEQKGLHRLLHAMTLLRQAATLTVVGAGRVPDDHLTQLAATLGLADRIEWLPLLTQQELAHQYRRAAIHVVPSLDEGLGLTAVESLLTETPVVAFASGGLPDIVLDGVTGRLVPPGDEPALASAIDALLADEPARRAMGVAGRMHAERTFGSAAASQRYASLYRDVATRRPRRRV